MHGNGHEFRSQIKHSSDPESPPSQCEFSEVTWVPSKGLGEENTSIPGRL